MKTCLVLALASMVILPSWAWGQEKTAPSSPAPVLPVSSLKVEEKLAIRELQVELKDLQLQIQDLVTRATDVQNRLRQKVSDLQAAHGCKDCSLDASLGWVVPKPQAASMVKGGGK